MRFKGLIIAHEDRSYVKSDKERVQQDQFTCVDMDGASSLKDTVDITIPRADLLMIKEPRIGQTVAFTVSEIRPPFQGGTRLRFTASVDTSLGSLAPAPEGKK